MLRPSLQSHTTSSPHLHEYCLPLPLSYPLQQLQQSRLLKAQHQNHEYLPLPHKQHYGLTHHHRSQERSCRNMLKAMQLLVRFLLA